MMLLRRPWILPSWMYLVFSSPSVAEQSSEVVKEMRVCTAGYAYIFLYHAWEKQHVCINNSTIYINNQLIYWYIYVFSIGTQRVEIRTGLIFQFRKIKEELQAEIEEPLFNAFFSWCSDLKWSCQFKKIQAPPSLCQFLWRLTYPGMSDSCAPYHIPWSYPWPVFHCCVL